jgi:hypothetical protein
MSMIQESNLRKQRSIQGSGGSAVRKCYISTFARCFFNSPRLRFESRIFCLSTRGRGDLRRRSFSRAATCARRSARCRFSIASSNRPRASLRFCACERESWTLTLIPLGRCRNVTAVETLFTFCPPGPPDRAKISSRSLSRMPSFSIRSRIESIAQDSARANMGKALPSPYPLPEGEVDGEAAW